MTLRGWFASKLMHAFYPVVVARSYQGMTTDWLADVEADHESWQPDELWAAQKRHPAGATPQAARGSTDPSPEGSVQAAGTAPPCGAGGLFKSDEQVIKELVADYEAFIRDCITKSRRN